MKINFSKLLLSIALVAVLLLLVVSVPIVIYCEPLLPGLYYSNLGQHQKAIAEFSKDIESTKNGSRTYPHSSLLGLAYVRRGNEYKEVGQFQKAIDDYNKCLSQFELQRADYPFLSNFWRRYIGYTYGWRGDAYERQGQYEKAVDDYDKLIEIDPKYSWARARRAVCISKTRQ